MLTLFKKWFTSGSQLGADDLKATVRLVVRISLALFLIVLLLGAYVVWGTHRPTAVEEQAPDAMVRLVISVGVWSIACLVAYTTIQAWDNTSRVSNLLRINPPDTEYSRLAKIIGAAMIDLAIILASALVFSRVVGI